MSFARGRACGRGRLLRDLETARSPLAARLGRVVKSAAGSAHSRMAARLARALHIYWSMLRGTAYVTWSYGAGGCTFGSLELNILFKSSVFCVNTFTFGGYGMRRGFFGFSANTKASIPSLFV